MNSGSDFVHFFLHFFHLFVAILSYDISAVLDNFIIGTPKVICGESEVALDIITAKPFIGNIFVKGRAKDTTCRQSFSDPALSNGTNTYVLSLGKCGMQRLRSANPRGVNFAVTVVVSFHPAGFITKTDRAFHLNCFYTEPDEIVTSSFEVSQLPTQELSDQMQMPTCHYSVHSESIDGAQLTWANVGDVVFHVWECRGPEMGILIKKCFVTDGDGEDHAVVDEDGCSLDHSLISEVTYEKEGIMRAHAKSQVFKYADSNQLFFTCQIRMCQRQMDMCRGVTPPKCEGREKRKGANEKKTAHSEDEKRAEEITGEERVAANGTKATRETAASNGTTMALPTEAQRKKKQQRPAEVAEEEEEDGEEEGQWVLKRMPMAEGRHGRKSRALAEAEMPLERGDKRPLEVDVASPQMLVLDQEDRARMTTARWHSSSTTAAPSPPHSEGQNAGEVISALDALRGVPSLHPPLCLSHDIFVFFVPFTVALLVGLGSVLTLCILHAFSRVARPKVPMRWTPMLF